MTDLSALREIVDGATPGPWFADVGHPDPRALVDPVCDMWGTYGDPGQEHRDAKFIATFDPWLVLALLDVAEAAGRLGAWSAIHDLRPDSPYRPGEFLSALERLDALTAQQGL